MNDYLTLLFFVLAVSIFLGVELISKVPSKLHTPLMSGSNAISGVILVGAIIAVANATTTTAIVFGALAIFVATVNIVGGYVVTERMLRLFKKK